MTNRQLNADTQAILLLCGGLGKSRSTEAPLTASEYHKLAQWLHANRLRPGDLLKPDIVSYLFETFDVPINPERISQLMLRGAALALAVESWSNKGLWVISRSDPEYPQRVKSRLGRGAPPLLYGAGNCMLLAGGGIAVVGSRDIDEPALAFTRRVATACGRQGLQVISGAARGVDSEAMQAAVAAGGTVVGVLADSLMKASVAGKYREALRAGKLALVTAYEPEVAFSVRNAMGRNKYIYTFSDYALVVSTSLGEGGTWSGATENLTQQWVPVFVRSDALVPPGNRQLLEMGARPFDAAMLDEQPSLSDVLAQRVNTRESLSMQQQDAVLMKEPGSGTRQEEVTPPPVHVLSAPAVMEPIQAQGHSEVLRELPSTTNVQRTNDLFDIIWPYLAHALQIARTERELAEHVHIEISQARAWLQRAVEEGKVTKLMRPVRYMATSNHQHLIDVEPL